jgi:hypothetical protein
MSTSVKAGKLPLALAVVALPLADNDAHAELAAPAEPEAATSATVCGAAPYCPDLKQVTALATSRGRFTTIAGTPREGNFRNTTLPLTGWNACALYGAATYTCDSRPYGTKREAERAQGGIVQQITLCLGDNWAADEQRSAAGYIVVRPRAGAASITLSLDQNDQDRYLVRLTLFLRAVGVRQ